VETGPHSRRGRTEVRTKVTRMVQDAANQLAINKPATSAALAAVCSPAWLPTFHDVSATTAELIPVIGAVYLLLQIAHFLITKRWRKLDATTPSKDDNS